MTTAPVCKINQFYININFVITSTIICIYSPSPYWPMLCNVFIKSVYLIRIVTSDDRIWKMINKG